MCDCKPEETLENDNASMTRRKFVEKSAKAAALGVGASALGPMIVQDAIAQSEQASEVINAFTLDSIEYIMGDERMTLIAEALDLMQPLIEYFDTTYGIRTLANNLETIRYTDQVSTYDAVYVNLVHTGGVEPGHQGEGHIVVVLDRVGNLTTAPIVKGIYFDSVIAPEPGDSMRVIAAIYDTETGVLDNWDFQTPHGGGFVGVPQELFDRSIFDNPTSSDVVMDENTKVPVISANYTSAFAFVSCSLCEEMFPQLQNAGCGAVAKIIATATCGFLSFICSIFFKKSCEDVLSSLEGLFGLTAKKACEKGGFC
jgi:hypothetical protein